MKKILMIPGPIEYENEVLSVMSLPTIAHTSREFINILQEALRDVETVFGATSDSVPYIISGSGTLAMEISTANFISRNSRVLVVSTGYFGDRFAELVSRFTKSVEVLRPPLGLAADPEEVKEAAERKDYDLITVTHVDTSTGVRNDVKEIAGRLRGMNPLLVVDGVCSVGGEAFDMNWGIDVAFSGSQKALGAPPGLAVGVIGSRALERMEKVEPLTYYSDFRKWMPVFRSALDGKASYFATPNVNLVTALHASLKSILREGIEERVRRHEIIGQAIRSSFSEMGMEIIARSSFANTVSAVYLPENVELSKFLAHAEERGVVFAGGLIEGISQKYFRIGHMGSIGPAEVLAAINAAEASLRRNGAKLEFGRGVPAAQRVLEKLH
ncbi:MAG: pyridoxal-phosphate-dependent aminotransferase family protein [Thermoplasmata archaeon]